MLAFPFTCILISSIGSEDFTIDPVTVTFAVGEGSVTAAISLTQNMISELEEQFLLRLIEQTSIGGALVEDLVMPPNEATVLIRDPGGELHRTLHSECCCLCLCEAIRASSITVLYCTYVHVYEYLCFASCVCVRLYRHVCTMIVHMTLCKDTFTCGLVLQHKQTVYTHFAFGQMLSASVFPKQPTLFQRI